MMTKKFKWLKWLLAIKANVKRGLTVALFLFFSATLHSQIYLNRLYNTALGTSNVLVTPTGYFLAAQIQPGNAVGIASLYLDAAGDIIKVDTSIVLGYYLFPALSGSSLALNDKIFFLGVLQNSPTNAFGALYQYNGGISQELARHKYQDSITVAFHSFCIGPSQQLLTVGLSLEHTGGQNEYQNQLLLMQLVTLGNKIWERSHIAKAGLWHLQGNSIIATQDGGYAIGGGGAYAQLPNHSFAYILLVDSLGNKINERYFMNDDYGNFVIQLQQKKNGNFLIVYSEAYAREGSTASNSSRKIVVEELDKSTLSTVWHKEYLSGFRNTRGAARLIPQNDSTYLICGTYRPDEVLHTGEFAAQLGFIFAITENGDSLWYRDYLNGTDKWEYNYLNDIAITPDGGIVGSGSLETSNSPYTGGLASHVWLFKTDSIGCLQPGCDTVYQKPKPPVTAFKVYPNPAMAGQELFIEIPNTSSATATLCNAAGKIILQTQLNFESTTATLQLPAGSQGFFVLSLQTHSGKNFVTKVVLY